jgi:dTDP-4-dehydrorhamnose 3,5-epimerase
MQVTATKILGVFLIEPKRSSDARGFFVELFHTDRYATLGLHRPFVQDNWSRSTRGVLRGLHLQNPRMQAKLVSVLRGEIFDVAVDVRVGSPTFGQYFSANISEYNGHQLFMPRGVAHGFQVISETADFIYKCDDFYSPDDEIVVRWSDPSLAIGWPLPNPILSPRDATAPLLSEIACLPRFGA